MSPRSGDLSPPLFDHQQKTVNLLLSQPRVFDASDPGTGKTRSAITAFADRRRKGGGKALVIAPKSILQASWGNDIDRFCPGIVYSCAYATNRKRALEMEADIYITNHDAVTWLVKNMPEKYWKAFDTLIVDESDAFKHASTARSRALKTLSKHFEYRELMTGTPNPNSITELWHQMLILDDGQRLGKSFYQFRNAVCEPTQVGPSANHIRWTDKPGVEQAVYGLIDDVVIRHKFEECVDIPPNFTYPVYFDLPPALRAKYELLKQEALLAVQTGVVSPVSASALSNKLAQLASGAVYLNEDQYEAFDDTRTELIMDLVEARQAVVVPFIWKHQRDALVQSAEARGLTFGTIDGTKNDRERNEAIKAFQNGELRVIFIQPQSAAHGITLTRGTATIFASPTYHSGHYIQVMHRIYRTGQTEKTETIHVIGRNTIDELIYERLDSKITAMQLLLQLAEIATKEAA